MSVLTLRFQTRPRSHPHARMGGRVTSAVLILLASSTGAAFATDDGAPQIVVERGTSGSYCNSRSPVSTPWDEGRTLRLEVRASDLAAGGSVVLDGSGFPAGMEVAPTLPVTGQPARLALLWTPAYSDVGSHTIDLWAVDAAGHRADCAVNVFVRRATSIDAEPILAEIGAGVSTDLGAFTATLTEVRTGLPVADRLIDFRIGADAFGCSALTDAFGVASCGNVVQSLVAAQGCGYFALFTAFGDQLYGGSADRGPIVRVAEMDSPC